MKVLVNAYACSPYQGSEPGMGWNFVKCLSKNHELHVITESKYERAISEYLASHPDEFKCCKFYFVKRARYNLLRKIWPPSYYWFYKAWQKKVLKLALELDKKENFDLVHQLNMIGYREPGYLWRMNKPFVWGPIGGFNITPWKLLYTMGAYGLIFYACRNLLNLWQMKTSRRVRNAIEKASGIMCATQEDSDTVKRLFHKDNVILPEVGLTKMTELGKKVSQADGVLKLCWSGLHIPRKSLNFLLESMVGLDNVELHVLGDGPKRKEWMKLSNDLHLTNVVWHGNLPRENALLIMQGCDVFVQTSLSDATSTVLLEALSLGLPVVALNHLGFANVITDNCGIKIRVDNKRQIVCDFAKAIDRLNKDRCLLKRLSEGAVKRAEENSWESKSEILCKIYENAVTGDAK